MPDDKGLGITETGSRFSGQMNDGIFGQKIRRDRAEGLDFCILLNTQTTGHRPARTDGLRNGET